MDFLLENGQIILIAVTALIAIITQFKSEKTKKKWGIVTIILILLQLPIQIYMVDKKKKDDNVRDQRIESLVKRSDSLVTQNQNLLNTNMQLIDKIGNYQKELEEQKQMVEAVKDYAYVARLDPNGKEFQTTGSIVQTTAISEVMEPAIEIKGDSFNFKCDKQSQEIYLKTIQKFPHFPFSYYGMAWCLIQNSDKRWRDYAIKGVEIFKRTVMIGGHKENHNKALQNLLVYLKQ